MLIAHQGSKTQLGETSDQMSREVGTTGEVADVRSEDLFDAFRGFHARLDRDLRNVGDGLCIGRGSGDAVSHLYDSPGDFKNGTILAVGVTVEKTQYLDLEKLAAAALAVE